jgi:hypothetical protein
MGNVFSGDAAEAGGQVIDVVHTEHGAAITCEVWLKVNGDSVAVSGRAVLWSPPQAP